MKGTLTLLILHLAAAPTAAEVLKLTPERTVELALSASHREAAAGERVAAADRLVDAADAARLPTVDIEARVARRSSVPEVAFPDGVPEIGGFVLFPDIQSTYRTGVAVQQPVWTGGAVSGGREAARHELSAASADAERVAAEVRLEARLSYWRTMAATGARDAALAETVRAERLLEDAQALRAAGMAVRADELGAEARLASARVRLIDAEAELGNRRAELLSLLLLPAGAEIVVEDHADRLPTPPAAAPALVAQALEARPELAALAARRDALASRSDAAAAPARPQVSLAASWDFARPNERFLPLEDEWNRSWSVGVLAGWRIFDGDRTGSEVASLKAQRAALEADLAELRRRVALDVETTRRDLEAALAATVAAEAAVAAAAAREADSLDRYTSGVATVAEVLDAQSELAEAELALVRARSGAWVADAALKRAVGL